MYNSLEELLIQSFPIRAAIDNDNVTFYHDNELVYEDHPASLMEDLLHYLGIHHEQV